MGGTARLPEAPPKGESKSNGEVERAVQAVHGLARTLKDFLEQQFGITVESRSPLLAWLVEHCSDLLLLFHKGEPHDGHTAHMPLKGKPWRIELPSFGECVDRRKGTRHKLEVVERCVCGGDSGTTNPSNSSGSGQHKRVRFSDQDLEPKPDTEMQTGGHEAPVTRKRSAETDAELLEEETAETAKADADKRIALKRKTENDPSDSEVENSAMNSLAELWYREDDPDKEVDLLFFQQRDRYVASVHETGCEKPACEEPKTPFPYDECGWDHIDGTSGKLLNNTPTKVTSTNRSITVDKSCKSTNDMQIGHFSQPLHRSRLCEVC